MTENKGHSRLRRLSLDYARGRISRRRYLRERSQFLDALSARPASADPAASQPSAESRPNGDEPTIRVGPVVPKPAAPRRTASADKASRKRVILAAVIGITAVLIALLMSLFPREDLQQSGHRTDNGTRPQTRVGSAPAGPGGFSATRP